MLIHGFVEIRKRLKGIGVVDLHNRLLFRFHLMFEDGIKVTLDYAVLKEMQKYTIALQLHSKVPCSGEVVVYRFDYEVKKWL